MVIKKLYENGIFKKKFNKNGNEILSNIELLCFLDINNINKFKNIILDHLKKYYKLENFIKYLNNYLFKLPHQAYNYSQLIKYFEEKNNSNFINKLYTTNNIVESVNAMLAFNLPKRVTQNIDFVKSVSKLLSIESLDIKNSKRKDYKTQALLKLIQEEELNKKLKWISFENFLKYLKLVIKKENHNMNEIEVNKLIENYNNILNDDNYSQDDDDKKEDNKISGNKSNISSEEENNNIIIENQNNINENIMEEIEDDDINNSYDNLENKDEQKLIDNIINLIEECNIDNNFNSQGNKKDDNKNNTIINEYNWNSLEKNKNIYESKMNVHWIKKKKKI